MHKFEKKRFASCTKLTTLDLAGNRIKRLQNISHLVKLEEFWFNDNHLESWEDLNQLTPLKNLQTVYLERNPLWRSAEDPRSPDPNYRRKVMLTLPWLQQIDATFVR
ncbi:protein phosphatase 1 regulatory subunit 7-like [Lingula anatina]|uniref:Protein phosphatase 1 regulatory subunit 7-like n=1 Tax=Lingula anatina TaxID=7574 RepID=A0A2R2MJM4_LINAN|nr:protein phosphatase 1 regulatory subunit 7-like [Lingula anatina]|eukprot:XP_023930421.1 protein phosphatase 1 regulatory subunit 7-like [Lingula anatina]